MRDPVPDNMAGLQEAFASGDADAIWRERKEYSRQLEAAGVRTPMTFCPAGYDCSFVRGVCLFCGQKEDHAST